jgi:hypothetical protein
VLFVLTTQVIEDDLKSLTDKRWPYRWTRWGIPEAKIDLKALCPLIEQFLEFRSYSCILGSRWAGPSGDRTALLL